jgi:hypothetical protein
VDPHYEKYLNQSPFIYAGNNPIKFVDYDGNDYGVRINHSDKTITISATYYATAADLASAQQAVNNWNSESGNFSYNIGKGQNSEQYTVNFDLKVSEVAVDPNLGTRGSLSVALSADRTGEGNIYMVVPDTELSSNQNGVTVGGNFVRVKNSRANNDTGSHEIGHSLGVVHSEKGLMTPSSTDPKRTNSISRKEVNQILKYPMRNKVNSENSNPAGKGTLKDVTPSGNSYNDWSYDQRLYVEPSKFKRGEVE